jgi:hypothetical protein
LLTRWSVRPLRGVTDPVTVAQKGAIPPAIRL